MPTRGVQAAQLDAERSASTLLPIELEGVEIVLEARAYQGKDRHTQAMALINRGKGNEAGAVPIVRVHSGCVTGDIFHSLRCDCRAQLEAALKRIAATPNGVLVYLPYQEGRGIGLFNKIKAYALQDQGMDTVEANLALGWKADPRDYGVGIQLLKDLGLRKVRLLTNNPKKTDAFIYGGFDLEVVDQIPIVGPIHEHNAEYLATKREKLGHRLPRVE